MRPETSAEVQTMGLSDDPHEKSGNTYYIGLKFLRKAKHGIVQLVSL